MREAELDEMEREAMDVDEDTDRIFGTGAHGRAARRIALAAAVTDSSLARTVPMR